MVSDLGRPGGGDPALTLIFTCIIIHQSAIIKSAISRSFIRSPSRQTGYNLVDFFLSLGNIIIIMHEALVKKKKKKTLPTYLTSTMLHSILCSKACTITRVQSLLLSFLSAEITAKLCGHACFSSESPTCRRSLSPKAWHGMACKVSSTVSMINLPETAF
ncbi:hypothetical protein B9Z19DRAFT_691143 [Tuber borchii]|uniref:Uncharacterized protein n=1 Tax=Tuber borchii TaxID=42251 RepID=A0A2T6ZZ65_TUBBO|nr:hypothetical protein B9Z19DRAFT_691143 [Tuber borchii]